VIMDRSSSRTDALSNASAVRGGITIEITENVFFGDYDRLMRFFRARPLRHRVFDRRLRHRPFVAGAPAPVARGRAQIDRSFSMDMMRSKDDAVIVKSTIDLAQNLGPQGRGRGRRERTDAAAASIGLRATWCRATTSPGRCVPS